MVGALADLGLVALEAAVGVADARLAQLDLAEGAVDLVGGEVDVAVRVGGAVGRVLAAVAVDEPLAVQAVDELHPVEAPLRRDGRAEQAEGDGAVAELAQEGVLHAEAEVDVVDCAARTQQGGRRASGGGIRIPRRVSAGAMCAARGCAEVAPRVGPAAHRSPSGTCTRAGAPAPTACRSPCRPAAGPAGRSRAGTCGAGRVAGNPRETGKMLCAMADRSAWRDSRWSRSSRRAFGPSRCADSVRNSEDCTFALAARA